MFGRIGAAAVAVMLATSVEAAHEDDLAAAFRSLSEMAEELGVGPLADAFCTETVCEGMAGLDIVRLLWPEGGWVIAEVLPSSDTPASDWMAACGAIALWATGLPPESAGAMMGVLIAEAESGGKATVDSAGAQLAARKWSSTVECEARRPRPLLR